MCCEAEVPHLDLVSWAGGENSQGSVQTLDPVWLLGLTVAGGEISGLGGLGIPKHGSVCSYKASFTQEHVSHFLQVFPNLLPWALHPSPGAKVSEEVGAGRF